MKRCSLLFLVIYFRSGKFLTNHKHEVPEWKGNLVSHSGYLSYREREESAHSPTPHSHQGKGTKKRQEWAFAECQSYSGRKTSCWDANNQLGLVKQRAYIIQNGNFLCFSCPSGLFSSQQGVIVPRD